MHPDPYRQFAAWYDEAKRSGVPLPDAMTLATVSSSGQPSARVVLLKEVVDAAFVFVTNTQSHKARDIAHNPRGALLFYWSPLDRQVRIQGSIHPLPSAQAAALFAARPRDSQIAAHAARQSHVVSSRQALDEAFAQCQRNFPDDAPVPMPADWGAYGLRPERFEFWLCQANRLHDRIVYRSVRDPATPGAGVGGTIAGGSILEQGWERSRLAP